jgi:hypothetical protein
MTTNDDCTQKFSILTYRINKNHKILRTHLGDQCEKFTHAFQKIKHGSGEKRTDVKIHQLK